MTRTEESSWPVSSELRQARLETGLGQTAQVGADPDGDEQIRPAGSQWIPGVGRLLGVTRLRVFESVVVITDQREHGRRTAHDIDRFSAPGHDRHLPRI